MKKILLFVLTLALVLPTLSSCASQGLAPVETQTAETPVESITEQEATQSETGEKEYLPQSSLEQRVTKILIIGNSATNDVFFQLSRVFLAQGFKDHVIGFLYYSGCSIVEHVGFGLNNQPVYDYYKSQGDGSYSVKEECTMKSALKDQKWDVVFINPVGDDLLHEDLRLTSRRKLEEMIHQNIPTVHTIAFHLPKPCPNDMAFYSGWWREPPAGYREDLTEKYGFDPIRQFTMFTDSTKKHIVPDETYSQIVSTGSAIVYAMQKKGVSQLELFRDYTHLTDFARVIASYSFYAQFTGQPIEEVKLDLVPKSSRQAHYQPEGDLVLTPQMKEIIKESANYSLEHPLDVAQ